MSLLTLIVALMGMWLPMQQSQPVSPECDPAVAVTDFIQRVQSLDTTSPFIWQDVGIQMADFNMRRARCSGLVFEGSQSRVVGPIEIPTGVYRVRADVAEGFFSIDIAVIGGECGGGANGTSASILSFISEQGQTQSEGLMVSGLCLALLEVESRSTWEIVLEAIPSPRFAGPTDG